MTVTDIVDQVKTLVKEMSLAELQDVVLRLAEQTEHVHAAFYQVWKEREREARVRKSVAWEPADWLDAREHFEPIIQDELSQCASLFQDRYEYADRGYDYYDSDEVRWDYTAGLEQLKRWFAEMQEMAADGEWVDASVGQSGENRFVPVCSPRLIMSDCENMWNGWNRPYCQIVQQRNLSIRSSCAGGFKPALMRTMKRKRCRQKQI